jgi:hypothetical protein
MSPLPRPTISNKFTAPMTAQVNAEENPYHLDSARRHEQLADDVANQIQPGPTLTRMLASQPGSAPITSRMTTAPAYIVVRHPLNRRSELIDLPRFHNSANSTMVVMLKREDVCARHVRGLAMVLARSPSISMTPSLKAQGLVLRMQPGDGS